MSHPVIGSEILRDVDFLGEGKLVVRHHHERWDGTGLPGRAQRRDDPARRARVRGRRRARRADHRPPVPPGLERSPHARDEIRAGSGTQFDPTVVDAYEQIADDVFERLRERL